MKRDVVARPERVEAGLLRRAGDAREVVRGGRLPVERPAPLDSERGQAAILAATPARKPRNTRGSSRGSSIPATQSMPSSRFPASEVGDDDGGSSRFEKYSVSEEPFLEARSSPRSFPVAASSISSVRSSENTTP